MECIFSIPIFSTVQSKRGLWRDGSVSDKTKIYFYYGGVFFVVLDIAVLFLCHVFISLSTIIVLFSRIMLAENRKMGWLVVLDLFHKDKHIINADCAHVDVGISI